MKTLKDMENSMKQANEKNQKWRDAQDVEKALIDYCHGQEPSHRFSPITILDLRAFATYYAQRCGVVINEKSKTMKQRFAYNRSSGL